jgi:hypothetical protein
MTIPPPALWAFLGLFAGGWKLAIVAGAILAVFGRRLVPLASRWLSPNPRTASRVVVKDGGPSPRSTFNDRVFLVLLVMAATAVATWIIVHFTIAKSMR